MSTTIRVKEATRDRLAAVARATDRSIIDVMEEAVDALERRVFFRQLNQRYAELRADESEWADVLAERDLEAAAVGNHSR